MRVPLHTLVQISDVHLMTDALMHGRTDTVARLRTALELVTTMADPPEALLLTGDLADGGVADAYAVLRELVEPVLAATGARLVAIPGNHDDRAALNAHLLGADPAAPLDGVLRLGGLRVVALDSKADDGDHGTLSDAQLAWLAAELAEPAPDGTLLLLHHTPLPSPVGLFDELTLERPEALAEVLAGSDVRLVLCGHAHHPACGALGGVPVWIAPSTSYTSDVLAPRTTFRGMAGAAGITRVDVFAATALATLVPLEDRAAVVELPVAEILDGLRTG